MQQEYCGVLWGKNKKKKFNNQRIADIYRVI